jgi:Ca-activated chloride channel family protein
MVQALPRLSEEVVSEQALPEGASSPNPEAGFGALRTERGCLPLRGLNVRARLDGLIATIDVEQVFVNAHDQPLEATYIFPLPDRAAVTRFRLQVAGRVVEGDLQERGAARKEYDRAIQAGHRAAIAEEERPGVFTMRVGNLPPGEAATVRLALVGPLPYSDGEVTFRFPLVVAPRYVPGVPLPGPSVGDGVESDTDAVPDASRLSPPVLLPGFPNPVRLSLAVEVPPSQLAPHSFRSSLHTVIEEDAAQARNVSAGTLQAQRFRLQPGERLDRDFILRFRLGADRVHTALSLRPDAQGEEGTFLLTVVPPAGRAGSDRPRDVVFVLDRSGSMAGWKMVAARRAVERMVETLTERDRFTVYAFDDQIEVPPGFNGLRLMLATDDLRYRAAEFLAKVESRGGTEMAQPLEQAVAELTHALNRSTRAAEAERVLVLITDGQVGNEDQILRQLGSRVKGVRIFTLGIDRAVNAAFLRRLADLGGGASDVVESEERLDEVMDQVHRHIGTPVLTRLRLEPAGLRFLPETLVPGRTPDLFAGAPLLISGRYRGSPTGAIAVRALDGTGQSWSTEVAGWREDGAPLASVWARGRVRELEDRYVSTGSNRPELEREIVATSLRFGVLCRFTAYVAVDREERVNVGGQVHGVVQPVEQPQGWGANASLGVPPPCAAPVPCPPMPGAVLGGGAGSIHRKAEVSGPRAAKKTMLAKKVLEENNAGGRVSKKTQLAIDFESTLNEPPPATPGEAAPAGPPRAEIGAADEGKDIFEETNFDVPALEDDSDQRARREARSPQNRRPRSASTGEQEGLLSRLLGLFRRKGKPASLLARAPYRSRAETLLQRLQDATPARLDLLRGVLDDLEALFKDLVSAGDRDPSVEELGQVVVRARELLEAAQPSEAAAAPLCQQAVDALTIWLNLTPPADPSAERREGFWK